MADNGGDKLLTCPLVIGVTGHRDIVESEIEGIERSVVDLFRFLNSRFPNTPLRLMSSLAEGADRIAAQAALKNGIEIQAVLPMGHDEYASDFVTPDSRKKFFELCAAADVLVLPPPELQEHRIESASRHRDLCYANAGIFISAHCHILVAIWDGRSTGRLGGTSQVVYFQHYDRLPGVAEGVPRTSLFLTDTESDLVFHIGCSRKCTTSKSLHRRTIAGSPRTNFNRGQKSFRRGMPGFLTGTIDSMSTLRTRKTVLGAMAQFQKTRQ